MLDLIEMNPTGSFAFGPQITIKLSGLGVTELTGLNHDRITKTANGCGKTNLLNTACHLLYGEDPLDTSDTKMVNDVWDKGQWGYLKYRTPRGLFRIVQARKWASKEYPDTAMAAEPSQLHSQGEFYRGTDLYFDEWDGACWIDKRCAKTADTRKAILATLPMSYQQFLTTSYMAQQKGLGFVTGKNKDRMQIISELMDMSVWDVGSRVARDRHTALSDAKYRLEGVIEGKNIAIGSMPQPLSDDALLRLAIESSELDDLIAEHSGTIDLLVGEIARIQSEIQDSLRQIERVEAIRGEAAEGQRDLGRQISRAQGDMCLAQNQAHVPKDPRSDELWQRSGDLTGRNNDLSKRIAKLDGLSGSALCYACDRPLQDVTAMRITMQAERVALNEQLKLVQDEMRAIRVAEETALAQLKASIELQSQWQIEQWSAQRQAAVKQISLLDDQIMKVNRDIRYPLEAELVRTQADMDQMTSLIRSNRARMVEISMIQGQNAQLAAAVEAARVNLEADCAQLAAMSQEILALSVVIKGMGDRGIKAHKFGSIIATLNELVKEYIDVLTDGQVQVWFTPFREKANAKDGDDVVAEVSIMVREGPKDGVELALYSGAEKQQITLAIICAFWRLASQQGGGTNILFLDEIFGSFDGPTASLAVCLIEKLRESHFGTIVVVTHDDKIKAMLEYDTHWLLEKRHHITTLTVQ